MGMSTRRAIRCVVFGVALLAECMRAHAQDSPRPLVRAPGTQLAVTTSWIGNTSGFGRGEWTQIDITSIAVSPDGRVFTDSPWDESGAEASVYQDGRRLQFAGGTHGWGNAGGNAVAINSRYAFIAVARGNENGKLAAEGVWPPKGRQWFGITRRAIGDVTRVEPFRQVSGADPHAMLASAFLPVNDVAVGTGERIDGLAATDTMLYAATAKRDEIDVFDAESMKKVATWPVHEPGRMSVAPDGTLWVLTDTLTGTSANLAHYGADGKKLPDVVALPEDTRAVDVTVDKNGRLLIADNGWRQQILIFTATKPGRYELSGTFGQRNGIWGGTPSESGRPGPLRFNGLTGVGVDAAGNIYVSMNGVGPHPGTIGAGLGASLQSYSPDGRLRWEVDGLLFVDGACADPGRRDSVFTGNKRFVLDFSQPPGHEWKYAGFLSNRFKYPEDTVFHMDQWPGTPLARRVSGRTFLYLTDMYADHLKIYRFDPPHDGETAIPSGFIAGRASAVRSVPNAPPGGEWIWRNEKGDGHFNPEEFERNTSGEKLAGGWGWWVDTKGDIWRANDTAIHRLRFGGIDSSGNPVYSYAKMATFPIPAPFRYVKRAIYDAGGDTLFVTGYTADAMPESKDVPKEIGRVLARYDHWSSAKPTLRYATNLLWEPGGNPRRTLVSVTVEGDYIFAVEFVGAVHVFDKNTGAEVGVINPGAEVGNTSGHIDVVNAITAHRRENGEYLVFVEEDARGKVMMYRWTPSRVTTDG